MANEVKTIMLMLTEHCNLNCRYCYEKNKSLKTMTYSTAIDILSNELNIDDGFEQCEIQFFGGEPFLEFELIKKICDFLWSNKWNKNYYCFVTTNGTVLTNEIKNWLTEHKDEFICALSLDGNKKAHDINRCNSYDMIDKDFFKKTWPFQPAKMTISPESLPFLADSVIELHDSGWAFDNNLAYGVDWSLPILKNELYNQLKLLSDYYIENPKVKLCRLLNGQLANILSDEKVKRWCGAGTSLKSYDVDGKCYPCHLFAPISTDRSYNLIMNFSELNGEQNLMDKKCEDCGIYNICPTCYGSNYIQNGNFAVRDEYLCANTKTCAIVASYIWIERLSRYTPNELGLSDDECIDLLQSSKLIQETLKL